MTVAENIKKERKKTKKGRLKLLHYNRKFEVHIYQKMKKGFLF